jgi:hypothetical protein
MFCSHHYSMEMRMMPQTVRLGRAMKSAPSGVAATAADRGGKVNRRRRPCPGRRNSQQLRCFCDVCHHGIGACRGPCCCYWPRLWPIMVKGQGPAMSLWISMGAAGRRRRIQRKVSRQDERANSTLRKISRRDEWSIST